MSPYEKGTRCNALKRGAISAFPTDRYGFALGTRQCEDAVVRVPNFIGSRLGRALTLGVIHMHVFPEEGREL